MDSKSECAFTYVETTEDLARLTEALKGTTRVGLDTEADSLHHYFEKVCLIQLSFSGKNSIVDPLAGLPMEAFLEELSKKELILQGADFDLRMLKKSFDFRPKAPVFDTMLAAQVLGYEKIGLEALVAKLCGVALTQSGQKSDWSRRPLSAGQLAYASDDTKYLEAIADAQGTSLRQLGRERWHRECCERVVETTGRPGKSDEKEAWRIKGSAKLDPKGLVFLRELWKWRDETARLKDRPSFMILRNEEIIECAAWRAANPHIPLDRGPVYLKRITGENLTRLEKAMQIAKDLPAAEWPAALVKPRSWTKGPSQEKVEALLAACRVIASELRIEPCFLASRAAVSAVIQHQAQSVEKVREVSGMMRWQAELVIPAIKTVLNSAS